MSASGSAPSGSGSLGSATCSGGKKRNAPDSIQQFGVTWTKTQPAAASRSHMLKYCTVYQPAPGTSYGDKVGRVAKLTPEHRLYVCHFDDHAIISKPGDATGNLLKHMKSQASSTSPKIPMEKQLEILRAVLDVTENAKGGAKAAQQLTFDDSGTKSIKTVPGFKSTSKDARPTLLRTALLGAAKHVSYAVLEDEFLLDVLRGLDPRMPKMITETIQEHQIELYSHLKEVHTKELATISEAYRGLPWAHLTTDMWTARHSGDAYSSLALRCTDPSTGQLKTFKFGVVKFVGQHTADGIKDHLESRLSEFNLSYDKDIASVATDSGANVRRCCLDLAVEKKIDWMPCILHGLHNSSKYAFGLVDEDIADDKVVCDIVPINEPELESIVEEPPELAGTDDL